MKKILSTLLVLGFLFEITVVRDVRAAIGDISTFAGGGRRDGGAALSALINSPRVIRFDAAGNMYIGEWYGNSVRKVDAITGIISAFVGTGRAGFSGDGGPANVSRSNSVTDMAFDSQGNLYLVESANRRVRRVDALTGIITTVAGTGYTDGTDCVGLGVNENLYNPAGVAIDANDDIYVNTYGGGGASRICKIDKDTNALSLVAGTGSTVSSGDGGLATLAGLNNVQHMVFDSSGNLFFAEINAHKIRRIDAGSGIISTYAGTGVSGFSGDGGLATAAQMSAPTGIAVDAADNVYFSANNRVRKIDAISGIITTVAGNGTSGYSGDGGLATNATFSVSGIEIDIGVEADPNDDELYIADSSNDRVRKVDLFTGIITTVAGSGNGDGSAPLDMTLDIQGAGIDIDAQGNMYIPDGGHIRKISGGTISVIAGTGTVGYTGDGGSALLANIFPNDIAIDGSGNIYFVQQFQGVVRKIDIQTNMITTIAGTGTFGFSGDGGLATAAQLFYPAGLDVDDENNVYIADYFNNRIRKVDAVTGEISTVAGSGTSGGVGSYSGDGGAATAATLSLPNGVRLDKDKNIYISDNFNHRIRKVDAASGIISTVAGNGVAGFSGDGGPATTASLNSPTFVHVDAFGDVFISDSMNQRIRKVEADTGDISTFAGIGAPVGAIYAGASSGDGGPATLAEINFPKGMTFDLNNQFYFLENNLIRKIGNTFVSIPAVGRSHIPVVAQEGMENAEENRGTTGENTEDEEKSGKKHGSAPEKTEYKMIPLIAALNQAFAWMEPSDYELRDAYRELLSEMGVRFKTRKVIQIIGEEYQMRELGGIYPFDFREPLDEEIVHVADLMKALILSFGDLCTPEHVLAQSIRIDTRQRPWGWWKAYWAHSERFFGTFMPPGFEAWDKVNKLKGLKVMERFLEDSCQKNPEREIGQPEEASPGKKTGVAKGKNV